MNRTNKAARKRDRMKMQKLKKKRINQTNNGGNDKIDIIRLWYKSRQVRQLM